MGENNSWWFLAGGKFNKRHQDGGVDTSWFVFICHTKNQVYKDNPMNNFEVWLTLHHLLNPQGNKKLCVLFMTIVVFLLSLFHMSYF